MREPKEVLAETRYYLITIFPDPEKIGYTIETKYKTITGARKRAEKELRKHGNGATALVRLETVYKRTETEESSTSEPFEEIRA